jgi:tRNA nucleotidyltransferase (CCA-adding enzyme)
VQERLKNHFTKYLQQVAEITPEEWATIPVPVGSPKYAKARDEFIWKRLDRRVKKVVEPQLIETPPPPPPQAVMGRRGAR